MAGLCEGGNEPSGSLRAIYKHGSSSLQLLDDDDGSALSLVILCPLWQWSSSSGDLYCMAMMLQGVATNLHISLRGSRVEKCVSGADSLHRVTEVRLFVTVHVLCSLIRVIVRQID
ncbi:hypothetical protein ANN_02228 [Periplaneta americana]|uniref:Uncharacterized protein n=1 Tax=Periplaneta americana TaxID=6978 RepID=A0ABQ8TY68_PERAM|nr:hypothetical protein ANN_02228 [Periplaneta americana]